MERFVRICWRGTVHARWNPSGDCVVCLQREVAQAELDLTLHATFDTRPLEKAREALDNALKNA